MAHNPFIQQGKAIPNNVGDEIEERWLNGTGQKQIAKDFMDNFCKRCHSELGIGGNRIWHARTDDVLTCVEFCKQQQPSITAREIQKKLVHNRVCLT